MLPVLLTLPSLTPIMLQMLLLLLLLLPFATGVLHVFCRHDDADLTNRIDRDRTWDQDSPAARKQHERDQKTWRQMWEMRR